MTVFLTDAEVQSVFEWRAAIAALREAYAAADDSRQFPPRTMARRDGTWLRTLSGIASNSGLMGAKLIAFSADAHASYLIPLFDQRTARLVALLDGHSVTGYRTAATSALAADLLASAGPLRVGVIGSGFEAKNHVRAIAALRELETVQVYSPQEPSRARFVKQLADLPCPVISADTPQQAVADATLVICAARSRDENPTLCGAWLRPGATVVSIGSTLPEQREIDIESLARADLIVADLVHEVLQETGDLIAARSANVDVRDKTCSLADVVSGAEPGRSRQDELVIYKSVGSAVQDLAVAAMCLRRSERLGIGRALPSTIEPVGK